MALVPKVNVAASTSPLPSSALAAASTVPSALKAVLVMRPSSGSSVKTPLLSSPIWRTAVRKI